MQGYGGTNCEASKPGSCPSKSHMKQNEYTAQFAVWAVMASQLILSADMRTLPTSQPDCFKLLTNSEILEVNQDSAAHAPRLLFSHNVSVIEKRDGRNMTRVVTTAQGFSRKLHDGSVAVVLLNRQDRGSLTLTTSLAALGLGGGQHEHATTCRVRDLLARTDLPAVANGGSLSLTVGSHEERMVRVNCGSGGGGGA